MNLAVIEEKIHKKKSFLHGSHIEKAGDHGPHE